MNPARDRGGVCGASEGRYIGRFFSRGSRSYTHPSSFTGFKRFFDCTMAPTLSAGAGGRHTLVALVLFVNY